MSVVLLGVLVQILGPALMGLVLLLVALLLSGLLNRQRRARILEQNPLLAHRLQRIARFIAGYIASPGSPRAPPARPPAGILQPVPVSTIASRRRRPRRQNDL
jgi:hypothetical protein